MGDFNILVYKEIEIDGKKATYQGTALNRVVIIMIVWEIKQMKKKIRQQQIKIFIKVPWHE